MLPPRNCYMTNMSSARSKWYSSNFCPTRAILPLYIKNPTLFSGTMNNPGSLATDVMRYAQKINNTNIIGQKRKTLILPVVQRVIPPLVNPSGQNSNFGSS